MSNEALRDNYSGRLAPATYDTLARLVFAPVGGLDTLREAALDALALGPGTRVLELGCGTGGLTEKLVARGAVVTAVDWSSSMLQRARRRAPSAEFVQAELAAYVPNGSFDVVLFAFVLHELEPAARAAALAVARRACAGGGAVVVLDHALPAHGLVPRALSALVHAFEPSSTRSWLRGQMVAEIDAAGLLPGEPLALAQGLAVLLVSHLRDA